ncbi:response regulator transcription factor [Streptomyces sp. NPDC054949]|uniref:response regulator transcription factor n=1 Tax=unclassified Streptomyces TaxID=2593676 RepID=UPI0006B06231|nr:MULTISPECIES: response regulator transcription factor [unclassified Streptomyces]MCX5073828.1 response regulator transcription factor [Streptomyces sp. NBC_00424]MCX5154611.1 response regulator transcription factor [Streptomyces sp. NBC_00291]WUD42952.1 response regulator transcription factor [Streptomyces sp. NBC_00513]
MRILVVEDEEGLAESLRLGLSADGHWVEVAHDGHRGLDLALTGGPYDAVLLDLMLPGLGGHEICTRLRAHGDRTPVLMLTAKDGEHDEADGLDAGADDYLTKPFSFVVLAARLRALARRAGTPRVGVLRAGDLVLDPSGRRCRRGERDIELTARELGVLACLMQQPGRAVAKQDILDEVWDVPHAIDPNIVEVYVSSLRRKIDAPFGRRSILTVHGTGYRMAPDGG